MNGIGEKRFKVELWWRGKLMGVQKMVDLSMNIYIRKNEGGDFMFISLEPRYIYGCCLCFVLEIIGISFRGFMVADFCGAPYKLGP